MTTSAPPPQLDVPDGNPHYIAAVTEMGEEREVEAHEDVYASNGIKLLAKGARIDRRQFERLTQHKLRMPLDGSLSSRGQLTASGLATEAAKLLENDPVLLRLVGRTGDALAVKHSLAGLKLPVPLTFRLTVMQSRRAVLFRHSLRCALIAKATAIRLQMSARDQEALLLAALCHDLGELHTDPQMLAEGHRITPEERRFIHVHPITGYMALHGLPGFPVASKDAVIQHHERLDGSGYPYGLSGARIGPLARVVAVVDVAEAVLRRFHRQRLDVMLRLNSARFDPSVVGALRDLIRLESADRAAGAEGGLNLERRCGRIRDALGAWDGFCGMLDLFGGLDPRERERLAFLFERMREVRSLVLQAGINTDDFMANLDLAGDDAELRGEIQSAVDEIDWRISEIANEVDLKAPDLSERCQLALNEFLASLGSAPAE